MKNEAKIIGTILGIVLFKGWFNVPFKRTLPPILISRFNLEEDLELVCKLLE